MSIIAYIFKGWGKTLSYPIVAFLAFAFSIVMSSFAAEARSITGVERISSSGEMSLKVTFEAGEPGDNHALYIAYDTEDKGADISDWAELQRGCIVAADATSATIPVSPHLTGKGYTVCRVFLTTSAAPYDTQIEYLRQTGSQYIDTGIRPDATSVAVMDTKFDSNDPTQQRFFGISSGDDATAGFSFDCYINGKGKFASACKDGKGDWKEAAAFTKDRVRISLSAKDKHRIVITNLVTGAQIVDKTWSTSCDAASVTNLLVFALHTVKNSAASIPADRFAKGARLYSFTMSNSSGVLCDYKPCKLRDPVLGNRVGVYDAVTKTIIYSASGTDFDAVNSGSPVACSSLLDDEEQLAAAPSATGLFLDYTWSGTAENWGDANVWTLDGENATWTDGNNAIFATANATATLAADVSANSITFSADATVAGTGTSDLSVKSVSVDPGVSAAISAPISSAFEKTGAGVLTLTQDRTTATIVKEGTLKMDGATVAELTLGTDGGAPVAFDYGGQELVKNAHSLDYLVTGSTVMLTNGIFSTASGYDLNIRNDTFTMPSVLTIAKDAVVRQSAKGKKVYLNYVNGAATINVIGGMLGNIEGCAEVYLQHKSADGRLDINVLDGGLVYFPCTIYALCGNDTARTSPALCLTVFNSAFVGGTFNFGTRYDSNKYVPTNPTGVFAATNSVISIGDTFKIGRNSQVDGKTGGRYTADFEDCTVTAKTFAVYYDCLLNNARFNGSRFVFNAAGGNIVASDDEANWFTVGEDGLIIDTQDFTATLNANLGGSGVVTKVGAGTLTVSRNQATTGGFNVSAGTLALNPGLTFAGSISVADGAKLDINAANTVNVRSLAFSEGSSLNIASYIGTTPLAVSTDVTLPESGTVNLTLDGGAFGEGVYAIYSNSKVTEEEGAKFSFSAADNLVGEWSVADNILILTVGEIDPNAWTGRGGDGKMSNGANWGGGIVPVAGADIDFSGLSGDTAIIADAGRKFGAVTMGAGVITFTNNLTATSFSDMSKIAVAADSTVTIDSDITITESSQRLCSNIAAGGKLRITGVLEVEQPSGNFQFSSSNAAGAVVVVGGIVMNTGSTSAGVLMNVKSLALGENGIAFTNNSPFRLISKPVVYALGERTVLGTNGRGLFRGNNAPFTFCTTQFESDQPATITLDARVTGVADYWAQWAVTGCGRFVTTAASGTNRGWTIEEGATFSQHPDFDTSSETSGQNYVVSSNATLEVGASGTLYVNGKTLTLADRASLGFNFTERATAPVFALGNKYTPTLTVGGAVAVKLSGVRPRAGEHVLTACGGFDADGVTVSLAEGAPKWAKGVYVNEDGNIVLDVKPRGMMIIVK